MRFTGKHKSKTIRADWWDATETVTIRRLSWGRVKAIEAAAIEIETPAVGGKTERDPDAELPTHFHNDERSVVTMLQGIESWTLRDDAGTLVPITREAILDLEPEDGDFILAEIESLNSKRLGTGTEGGGGATGDAPAAHDEGADGEAGATG